MSRWPVLDRTPVELPTLAGHEHTLWEALLELADLRPREWTLIGGQMVLATPQADRGRAALQLLLG